MKTIKFCYIKQQVYCVIGKGSKSTEIYNIQTNYYRKLYNMKISDNYCTKGLTCSKIRLSQTFFGNRRFWLTNGFQMVWTVVFSLTHSLFSSPSDRSDSFLAGWFSCHLDTCIIRQIDSKGRVVVFYQTVSSTGNMSALSPSAVVLWAHLF